jgi:hypothetical protein
MFEMIIFLVKGGCMLNIVILSHLPSTQSFYKAVFSHTPNVNCIVVPYIAKTVKNYKPVRAIFETLSAEKLRAEDIEMVLVSSNYGDPASAELNDNLVDFLLTIFPQACVIAVSNTPASLIQALEHVPLLKIMGNTIQDVQKELVSDILSSEEINRRTVSIKSLKALISDKSKIKEQSLSPRASAFAENNVLNKTRDDNLLFSVHRKTHKSNKPTNPFTMVMFPSTYQIVDGKFLIKENHPEQPSFQLQSTKGKHYTLVNKGNGGTLLPEGNYSFVLFSNPYEIRLSEFTKYNLDGKAFDCVVGYGEVNFKKVGETSIITLIKNNSSNFYIHEIDDDLLTKFKNLSFKQSLEALKIPTENYVSFDSKRELPRRNKSCLF